MKIATITSGVVQLHEHRDLFPNVSFPADGPDDEFLAQNNCLRVVDSMTFNAETHYLISVPPYVSNGFAYTVATVRRTPPPAFNSLTEKLVELEPTVVDGELTQQWSVVPMTDEEKATVARAIQNDIVSNTQKRLDDFARTRNYDNILSACTYATSAVPKFAAEGQYCVNARDNTWATLYTILAEVQAGTRPMPSGYEDIEPLLPVLEWPE